MSSMAWVITQRLQHERMCRRVAARFSLGSDDSEAEREAREALQRFNANKALFQELRKLGLKDKRKYGQGVDRLRKNGDKAQKVAEETIRKYEDGGKSLKGQAKRAYEAGLQWLDICIREWKTYRDDWGATSSEERLSNLYGGAQKLEAALRGVPNWLQGKDEPLDESWRES